MARKPKGCLKCGAARETGSRHRYCMKCRLELPTHKTCSMCAERKTINNFSATKGKLNARCINCTKEASRSSRLKNLYGITAEEYAQIKQLQNGKCAICQRATGATKALSVDHDHSIVDSAGLRASVRGLLCSTCNDLLGHVRDDPEALLRAINYLRYPPAHKVLGTIVEE